MLTIPRWTAVCEQVLCIFIPAQILTPVMVAEYNEEMNTAYKELKAAASKGGEVAAVRTVKSRLRRMVTRRAARMAKH